MARAWIITSPYSLPIQRQVASQIATLSQDDQDVTLTEVHGADLREGTYPDLRTADLFGSTRVFVVRNAETMSAEAGRVLCADILAGDLAAELILTTTGSISSKKLVKAIKDQDGFIELAVPKDTDTTAWERLVDDEFARHGLQANDEAVHAIIESAGYNVDLIGEKVAQVNASVQQSTVTGEDVANVVVGYGSKGVFVLADQMLAGDVEGALKALRGCLEAGDEPLSILGGLTYKVRQLISVVTQLSPKEGGVYVPRGQIQQFQAIRQRFLPGEMTKVVGHLAACDVEIKSGDLGPQAAIERCVLSIASSPVWAVPNPDREILR
ncbi:DNA polymerase III subunit delta [Stomatohabitans albus]|uniref:DNA polymerase III subunit delta n=1 Tax=Stomatohabitans albus TaxID=3110766 RepID=UPI00300C59FF